MSDEDAKNHKVPRLDPEVYRALLQTLGYCTLVEDCGEGDLVVEDRLCKSTFIIEMQY